MDGYPYKCDSSEVLNIEEVATKDSAATALDEVVWDVCGCSAMVS